MKFGNRFRNLLEIECTKLYSNLFRFYIFIARCLRGEFFTGHSVLSFQLCMQLQKCCEIGACEFKQDRCMSVSGFLYISYISWLDLELQAKLKVHGDC